MNPYCPKCGTELERSETPEVGYLNFDNSFSTSEYWECFECKETFIISVEYQAYPTDWRVWES